MRSRLLDDAGQPPTFGELLSAALERALSQLEARPGSAGSATIDVLDAGCGRYSHLTRYRSRFHTFTGADLHEPATGALPHLDRFVRADLCRDADAFAPASFDLVLSNFTLEHFADPESALVNLGRWLRPGGRLIVTTVNRRHPFVAVYLAIPAFIQRGLQRLVKARPSDAHPLVGACNDPRTVRAALLRAGLEDVEVETVGHLARAWRRRAPARVLGFLGDLVARPFPSRRSTIIALAAAPAA